MSDLLGSILKNMKPPPSTVNKDQIRKRQQLKRKREEETKKRTKLVEQIENEVEKFALGSEREFQFEPSEKEWRAIQHEVGETAGLITLSCFGSNNDKYVVLFKKEFCPSEDEMKKRRLGERYIEGYNTKSMMAEESTMNETKHKTTSLPSKYTPLPNSHYQDKLQKLVDKSGPGGPDQREYYGLVPVHMISEPKSIEESMSEIREKKRLKLQKEEQGNTECSGELSSSGPSSDSRTIKFT